MTTLAIDDFLRRWRWALRSRETAERAFWEGRFAYGELERSGYLQRVRIEEEGDETHWGPGPAHFIAAKAIRRICDEVAAYKRDIGNVRSFIDQQNSIGEWLAREVAVFRQRASRVARTDPTLSRHLRKIANKVDEERRGVHIRLKERWSTSFHGMIVPAKVRSRIRQERQLDGRFQVRLGAILRTYMPKNPLSSSENERGPSLRTIARLIVLFLACAELAGTQGGEVRLKHNNRRISVDGVLQQLRAAGIDQ